MNKFIGVGNITKDLELKKTPTNKSVLEFTIAINDQDKVDYINCQAWEKTAEIIEKYMSKGSKILVEGKFKTNSYDGQNGKVYRSFILVERVEFLDTKKLEAKKESNDYPAKESISIQPDELPFY